MGNEIDIEQEESENELECLLSSIKGELEDELFDYINNYMEVRFRNTDDYRENLMSTDLNILFNSVVWNAVNYTTYNMYFSLSDNDPSELMKKDLQDVMWEASNKVPMFIYKIIEDIKKDIKTEEDPIVYLVVMVEDFISFVIYETVDCFLDKLENDDFCEEFKTDNDLEKLLSLLPEPDSSVVN